MDIEGKLGSDTPCLYMTIFKCRTAGFHGSVLNIFATPEYTGFNRCMWLDDNVSTDSCNVRVLGVVLFTLLRPAESRCAGLTQGIRAAPS